MNVRMQRGHVLAAGIATGLLLVAPAVALADTPAPSPGTSKSETPKAESPKATPETKPEASTLPLKPGEFGLSVQEGVVGAKLTATGMCATEPKLQSRAITFTQEKSDAKRGKEGAFHYSGVVNDVKPGKYDVTLVCGQDKGKEVTKAVSFTVLAGKSAAVPPQTTRIPQGAPQTGGGGTQSEPSDLTAILLSVGAIAVAGGIGVAAYRRRTTREN